MRSDPGIGRGLALCAMAALLGACAVPSNPDRVVAAREAYGQDQDLGLACRLLMASRCAYAITATDRLDVNDEGHAWACRAEQDVVERRVFADGGERINAAMLERTRGAVILAFRGTLPPGGGRSDEQILRDWGADLRAELLKDNAVAGHVHEGFDKAVHSTLTDVSDVLGQWQREGQLRNKKFYITGHSKGGAMAIIAATLLFDTGYRADAVYTFAAPRAGDTAFETAYAARRLNVWRYENRYDVVPHVPPNAKDDALVAEIFSESFHEGDGRFASVGNLIYIDWSGHLTAAYVGLDEARQARFKELILPSRMATALINAHSSSKGDGYGKAVCQE